MMNASPNRLLSLDALRGFDMFWIISGEGIFHGFADLVMAKHALFRNPDNWQIAANNSLSMWEQLAVGVSNQLHHTPWNGFTFYDLIFPLFIFIAGISMPFSFGKQLQQAGLNQAIARKHIYRSLIRRTLLLILLGMVVNGLFKWQGYHQTRMASVLGRIALSCFFAALIYLNCGLRAQITWLTAILLSYWAAMMFIPVPGFGAGILTPEGNLSAWIDRVLLPGKLHRVVYDPEGLLSTIPAVGTALLGIFTGTFLQKFKGGMGVKFRWMMGASAILLLLGYLWGCSFPINKNIWSGSFVLYAGGWSLLLFAVFYGVIDVLGWKRWSMPFVWIGCNAILIYMAAHGFVNFESSSAYLFSGLYLKAPEPWHAPLMWMGVAVLQFGLLYWLYQRKWFLKV